MSGVRTDVGARCYLAGSFLKDLLGTLAHEDALWVRIKLGAEHLEQLVFAANSLRALEEIVGSPIDAPAADSAGSEDDGPF